MIFSYSPIAPCSLPCWTNFSAAASAFSRLKPNPNAIRNCQDENARCRPGADHYGAQLGAKVPQKPWLNPVTGGNDSACHCAYRLFTLKVPGARPKTMRVPFRGLICLSQVGAGAKLSHQELEEGFVVRRPAFAG